MNDIKGSRNRVFSRVGLTFFLMLVIATALQFLCAYLQSIGVIPNTSIGVWLVTFAPLYLIAVPAALLLFRRIPAQAPGTQKLSGKDFFIFLCMCFPIMYAGNIIGTFLSMALSAGKSTNTLLNYTFDTEPIKILVMVILAPIIEEYVFRKQIIDRTMRFGEKNAILLSAFVFAFFHMNLYQFFYAFGLGLIFGYVYMRTGRIRYSVILHAIINFMGGVVAPFVISLVRPDELLKLTSNETDPELIMSMFISVLPGIILMMLNMLVILGFAVTGIILLIVKRKSFMFLPAEEELAPSFRFKTIYLNVGMILYFALCSFFILFTLYRAFIM